MLEMYLSHYLSKNGIASKADIEDISKLKPLELCEKAKENLLGLKSEFGIDEDDLKIISEGDIAKIIPLFLDVEVWNGDSSEVPRYILEDKRRYNRFVQVMIENLRRFNDNNFIFKKAYKTKEYVFDLLGGQEIKGAHNIFAGLSGGGNNLLPVAGGFARKEFSEMNGKAADSVCEMINCINGLYVSEMSHEEVGLQLMVPNWYLNKKIVSNGEMYCLPAIIKDSKVDVIFSFDAEFTVV